VTSYGLVGRLSGKTSFHGWQCWLVATQCLFLIMNDDVVPRQCLLQRLFCLFWKGKMLEFQNSFVNGFWLFFERKNVLISEYFCKRLGLPFLEFILTIDFIFFCFFDDKWWQVGWVFWNSSFHAGMMTQVCGGSQKGAIMLTQYWEWSLKHFASLKSRPPFYSGKIFFGRKTLSEQTGGTVVILLLLSASPWLVKNTIWIERSGAEKIWKFQIFDSKSFFCYSG
jgi:hypothetical protein